MIRTLIVGGLCMLLAGCGDTPRVERKHVIESGGAETGPADTDAASGHWAHGEKPVEAGAPLPTGEMRLGDVQLTSPDKWVRKQPRFGFILAEFTLPPAEGDAADGRLTVSIVGGSIEENIARWRQQFGEKPEKASQEREKIAGTEVTLVDFAGTYHDDGGMHGTGGDRPDYRLLGAVFEVGGQLYFIKSYGPAKTMAAHADEFQAFIKSLKLVGR